MLKINLLENVKLKIITKCNMCSISSIYLSLTLANKVSDNSLKNIYEIQYWSTNMVFFKLIFLSNVYPYLSLSLSFSISLFTNLCPHTFILLSWEHFLFDVNYYIHINPDPTAWPSVILSIFTWQRNMHIREYNTSKVKREM